MNKALKCAILRELKKGKVALEKNKLDEAFYFFERTHILGQMNPYFHTLSHIFMLRVALKKRDFLEIIGQLFRIPSGLLGSIVGIVPTGNTGGAGVSPFKKMPIPDDLQNILDNLR